MPQSQHSIADFIYDNPVDAKLWKETSNYIISLQINNENELLTLYDYLIQIGINVTKFHEPDINEFTSICFLSTNETQKLTKKLKLSLI